MTLIMSYLTCEAKLADALVIIRQLDAVEGVGRVAGLWAALVDVSLTSLSGEPWRTVTAVSTHPVNTGAVVLALRCATGPCRHGAVVLIYLTQYTCVKDFILAWALEYYLAVKWTKHDRTYPVCQVGRSRCSGPPGQYKSLRSDTGKSGTHWSPSRSSAHHTLANTDMRK